MFPSSPLRKVRSILLDRPMNARYAQLLLRRCTFTAVPINSVWTITLRVATRCHGASTCYDRRWPGEWVRMRHSVTRRGPTRRQCKLRKPLVIVIRNTPACGNSRLRRFPCARQSSPPSLEQTGERPTITKCLFFPRHFHAVQYPRYCHPITYEYPPDGYSSLVPNKNLASVRAQHTLSHATVSGRLSLVPPAKVISLTPAQLAPPFSSHHCH